MPVTGKREVQVLVFPWSMDPPPQALQDKAHLVSPCSLVMVMQCQQQQEQIVSPPVHDHALLGHVAGAWIIPEILPAQPNSSLWS